MATYQTFTWTPTGATTKSFGVHFADGRVVHYDPTKIVKIVADGAFSGDSTVPAAGDPGNDAGLKDGSEQ